MEEKYDICVHVYYMYIFMAIVTNFYNYSVLQNGHAVSPQIRFLTSSGEWVWLQLEGTLRSNFWEIKIRALGLVFSHV